MSKRLYTWTRDLHLYLGLFVSPFVLLFAVSVFFLNHGRTPSDETTTTSVVIRDLQIPSGIAEAQGMERLRLAAEILVHVGVAGEINFMMKIVNPVPDHRVKRLLAQPVVE